MHSLWRHRGARHVLWCSDPTGAGPRLLYWERMSAEVQSTGNISWKQKLFKLLNTTLCNACLVFQMGGEQLERVLENLRGGFPVSTSSLLEDALAGPGQLGLQWPLHHGWPGETCGETALQEPRLWPTVGGGRVERGMRRLYGFTLLRIKLRKRLKHKERVYKERRRVFLTVLVASSAHSWYSFVTELSVFSFSNFSLFFVLIVFDKPPSLGAPFSFSADISLLLLSISGLAAVCCSLAVWLWWLILQWHSPDTKKPWCDLSQRVLKNKEK